MTFQEELSLAIRVASIGHHKQFTKDGNPYILHPLKVMEMVSEKVSHPRILCVAVLHDLLEDTGATEQDLVSWGFSERVVKGVVALTKVEGESYDDYLERVMDNGDATIVKMADIRHNSDLTRLKGLTDKDFERMKKYAIAYKKLESVVSLNWG